MSSEIAPEGTEDQPAIPPSLQLHEGEHVIMTVLPSSWWTLGRYIATFGLWAIWRKRHVYVLTNERVIVVKGIINTSQASAPLSRIQDLHVSRSITSGGKVEWSTAGGSLGVTKIEYVTRDDARRIAQAISPLIGREQAGT